MDKLSQIRDMLEEAYYIADSKLSHADQVIQMKSRVSLALACLSGMEHRHNNTIRRMSEHRDSDAHEQRIARELADEQRTIERATS